MGVAMYEPYETKTTLYAIEGHYESGEGFRLYRFATSEDEARKLVCEQYKIETISAVVDYRMKRLKGA
jgi:hypothetical protein